MEAVAVILALILWGMLLAVGYQFLLTCLSGIAFAPMRVFVYGLGILLCFGGTSVFLYFINGGDWGLYGFLATILGFCLYYKRFWVGGEKFFQNIRRQAGKMRHMLKNTGAFGIKTLSAPFAFVIKKGERRLKQWDEQKQTAKEQVISKENEASAEGEIETES